MRTIAIIVFLSLFGIIAAGVAGLLWLEGNFGPMAVVIAVTFLVVMAFVVIMMAALGVFNLALLTIFSRSLDSVADVHAIAQRNYGKLLTNQGRGGREAEPPPIDVEWWGVDQPALPAPQPQGRFTGVGQMLRKALPGSTATPVDSAIPLRRPQTAPAGRRGGQSGYGWGDDDGGEYDERLTVS